MLFQTRRATADVGAFFELAVLDCFLILGIIISAGCVTIRRGTSMNVKKSQRRNDQNSPNSESIVCTAF